MGDKWLKETGNNKTCGDRFGCDSHCQNASILANPAHFSLQWRQRRLCWTADPTSWIFAGATTLSTAADAGTLNHFEVFRILMSDTWKVTATKLFCGPELCFVRPVTLTKWFMSAAACKFFKLTTLNTWQLPNQQLKEQGCCSWQQTPGQCGSDSGISSNMGHGWDSSTYATRLQSSGSPRCEIEEDNQPGGGENNRWLESQHLGSPACLQIGLFSWASQHRWPGKNEAILFHVLRHG